MAELVLVCECGNRMPIQSENLGTVGRCTLCGRKLQATPANTEASDAPAATVPTAQKAGALAPPPVDRVLSMDQLRGYAIFGMILVNYLGCFTWPPHWFEHQRGSYSYADTIAPLFIFVVGMGFRLSFLKRLERSSLTETRISSIKRYLLLFLVGITFYGPAARIDWWDALVEIALGGLLALPFINQRTPVRIAAAIFYLALFTFFYFGTGYGVWLENRSMNGGPLGPLPSAFILLFGTIGYDLLASGDRGRIFKWSLIWAVLLIVAAFVCWQLLPKEALTKPELGTQWTFAKRWSLPPFACLSTGIAFLTFLFFYWLNDLRRIEIPTLTVLGMNPLVIYVLQYSLLAINDGYMPEDSGALPSLLGLAVFYFVCFAVAWRLWRDKLFLRL